MSSVLVKGMKMPECCEMCPIREDTFCDINNKDIDRFYNGSIKRDPDCPLVALPDKHGDLIDRNGLLRDIEHYHLSDGKFQHWVEVQDTIVEAEDSE